MRNLEREAACLREALQLGLLGVRDVVAWSDSVIAETDTPSNALIELSSMWKADRPDAVAVLDSLCKDVPASEVWPAVLRLAYQRLLSEPGYSRQFARAMYFFAVDHGYPSAAWWFDDAFDLAEQGIDGSVEDVQRQLLEFVRRSIEP